MPSFEKGRTVLYRSTEVMYTVVRWDQEAELLLLAPASNPPKNSKNGAGSNEPIDGKRLRTRWTFEHMVDLVEAGDDDPTSYARRAAKLDARIEIRFDPKRGRGLFALRDIPAGTEVMRVPAAAAVLLDRGRKSSCSGCLLSVDAVGSLEACHGCPSSFCADCRRGGTGSGMKNRSGVALAHKSATCELAKQLTGICRMNGGSDDGSLRLVADVLVRRKAGLIDDAEWDLLNSLESQDNEARTMSLAPDKLRECTRLFHSLVDADLSDDNVHAMYRRVTRNAHTVSPNTTKTGFGSVEGLFPFGALVNHSCLPNTFFHCVAEPLSASGPVVKQVMRSIHDIRAGEELCYSYLSSDAAMGTVSERRGLLWGWGFRCACKRCQSEAEEERRLLRHRTQIDEIALRFIGRLEQILGLGQRGNAPALDEVKFMPELQRIVEFYSREKERHLSPMLRYRIAVLVMDVTTLVGVTNYFFRLMVFSFAADELSELHNVMAITCRQRQYVYSTKVEFCDLDASQAKRQLEVVRTNGRLAREDARELLERFYGGQGKKQSTGRRLN